MADVVGQPLSSYVVNQIKVRQNVHGSGVNNTRTPEQIVYLNSRTAWVKLASGVRVLPERIAQEQFRGTLSNDTLAQQFILFGGTARRVGDALQTRSTLLDQDSGKYNVTARSSNDFEFGLVPMPGIESAEIKAKNRGSIREATVKLKVYDKDQFDIIDILYLRLGYTVLLEWGDSIYFDNGGELQNMGYTLIEDPSSNGFFKFEGTHTQYVKVIEGYRRGKDGNYDGLLGKVKNFEWSFAQDGSYDITLSIISVGDVIESLKSNITPPKTLTDFLNLQFPPEAKTKEEQEDVSASQGTIESSAKDNIISAYMLYWKIVLKLNYQSGLDYVENPNEITFENEVGLNPIGVFPKPSETGGSIPVSYGAGDLVKGIIERSLVEASAEVFEEVSTTGKDICYFNYNNGEDYEIFDPGFYWRFGAFLDFVQTQLIPKNAKTQTPIFDIDSNPWSNKMVYYPNQISFDPRVCVVNGSMSDYKIFPQLFPWKNENRGYAWIMNIYVSFVKIQECIDSNKDEEGNVALIPFLESICNAINEALGGVNNLEPIMDEGENILRIIDDSYSEDQPQQPYELELYGYKGSTSNFVRNIDLKTTITPEYATMVTVGATAGGYVKGTEATMFSKFNRGLVDRFKEKYIPANSSTAENPNEARDEYFQAFFNVGELALGYKLADISGDVGNSSPQLMDDVIDSNKSIATEYYKYLNAKAQEADKSFAGPTLGFIPFSLGLTMDGISGIKIYNEINVDTRFLPKNYPDNLRFIIKGVNHKLSNQDWETSLETVVIPNTLKRKPSYDLLKSLITQDLLNSIIELIPFQSTTSTTPTGGGTPPRSSTTPAPSSRGTAAELVGGRGVKTYGTLGKNGDKNQLSKDALTLSAIDNLVETSGAQNGGAYESVIRSRIVRVAASYVGNQEALPPQNPGWWDSDYEAKFKKLKAYPWSVSQPWCAWFCQLVWKEAYTTGNNLVSSVDGISYSDWYKSTWKTTLKDGALIGAGVSTCKNNFKGIGKYISVANAISGKYIPKPGDIAVYSYGHVDLVIQPFVKNGKLTGYSAIGGNTGDADARNGGETKYYKSKSLGTVLGFCSVLTPFNINEKYN